MTCRYRSGYISRVEGFKGSTGLGGIGALRGFKFKSLFRLGAKGLGLECLYRLSLEI